MKLSLFLKLILSTLLFTSCNSSSSGSGSNGDGVIAQGCTPETVLADNTTGGCRIRLVTPNTCAEVNLSDDKTYEFAWTTDGTTCETPWKVTLAGNPPTEDNQITYTVSTDGNMITQKGAVIPVGKAAFEGLRSDNGTYHWVVKSFYDSYPASKNFKVIK